MAISKIYKISIIGYNGIREEFIEELQHLGIVEITEIKGIEDSLKSEEGLDNLNEKISKINKQIEELNFIKDIIYNFASSKKIDLVKNERRKFSIKEYYKKAREFDENIISRLKDIHQKLQFIESRQDFIKTRIAELEKWNKIFINLKELEFKNSAILFCIVRKNILKELEKELETVKLAFIEIINEDEEFFYLYIIYKKDIEEKIKELIKNFNIITASFLDVKSSIPRAISDYKKELKELEIEKSRLEKEIKNHIKIYPDILLCIDYWRNFYNRENIKKRFITTKSTFILTGWIREFDIKKIDELVKKYNLVEYSTYLPEEGEIPPVDIINPPIIKPFEVVTRLFGLPAHNNIDPTPLLAPFFAIFFAIALTDAGYGIILFLLSFIIYKKYKNQKGTAYLMGILMISGILTVIIGALMGGWFGIDFDKFPAYLHAIKKIRDKLTILEPLKNPLTLFLIILGLGVIHVLTGFVTKFIIALKNKNYFAAFTEPFPWIIIISGAILFGLFKIKLMIILPVFGALIILLFSSSSKNIFVRLLKGLYGLYGITGVFGDIISYSRLFALGLSSSVIALVINVIAKIIYNMFLSLPYLGIFLAILFVGILIIFGHIFNILISSLGGFIHTTRLQFVEFFGKFYESGGNEFSPFREEFQYVTVE